MRHNPYERFRLLEWAGGQTVGGRNAEDRVNPDLHRACAA